MAHEYNGQPAGLTAHFVTRRELSRLEEVMRKTSGPQVHTIEGDGVVVARVLSGDREAYRVLVRRYQDLLYRHALRMTGHQDAAADLVQAALVRAYAQLSRCREPDRFGAWLFRILANGCKDHLKARPRRDVSLDAEPSLVPPASNDPEQDLERAELRVALHEALRELNEEQRQAFLLKHVEGRSYEEMSEMLGQSVPALKMRVHRAREALRSILQEVV
jgi:RNA polymerase sigma-70 factor (ECF subfamily)